MYIALRGIGLGKILIIFLLFFVLQLFPGSGEANDWPYWRGPNRNGITEEKGWNPQALVADPKILWKTNVGKWKNLCAHQQGQSGVRRCL